MRSCNHKVVRPERLRHVAAVSRNRLAPLSFVSAVKLKNRNLWRRNAVQVKRLLIYSRHFHIRNFHGQSGAEGEPPLATAVNARPVDVVASRHSRRTNTHTRASPLVKTSQRFAYPLPTPYWRAQSVRFHTSARPRIRASARRCRPSERSVACAGQGCRRPKPRRSCCSTTEPPSQSTHNRGRFARSRPSRDHPRRHRRSLDKTCDLRPRHCSLQAWLNPANKRKKSGEKTDAGLVGGSSAAVRASMARWASSPVPCGASRGSSCSAASPSSSLRTPPSTSTNATCRSNEPSID